MVTLKKGSKGESVRELQEQLNRLGFPVGPVDGQFGPITESAVTRFQRERNRRCSDVPLVEDGIVGPRTRAALSAWEAGVPTDVPPQPTGCSPATVRDRRLSGAIRKLLTADGQGCRYSGWSSSGIRLLEKVASRRALTVPLGVRIDPQAGLVGTSHGGTCSPFAGLFLGWLLNAHDFTWRIGRSADWMANWSCNGVEYKGKVHRGYSEYCSRLGGPGWHRDSLGALWSSLDDLKMVNFIEMSHHCIFVLKVGGPGGMNVLDPWTGGPLAAGLYRFGADGHYVKRAGKKYYSGTRFTFRLLASNEQTTQRWRVYRISDLLADGSTPAVPGGRYHGLEPLDLLLEGESAEPARSTED